MAGRRLLVDTGVFVASEQDRGELDRVIANTDDLAVAAVTVAELFAGVELASGHRRDRREELVTRLLEQVTVVPYDEAVARHHARLLAEVRRLGQPRGAHDLIVAATALRTGRTVLTTDAAARFHELAGVDAVLVRVDWEE